MFHWIREFLLTFFNALGFPGSWSKIVTALIIMAGLFFVWAILYYLIRVIAVYSLRFSNRRRPSLWKQSMLDEKLLIFSAMAIPAFSIKKIIPQCMVMGSNSEGFFSAVVNIFLVIIITLIISSVLKTIADVLLQKEATKDKPIKSYVQVVMIFFWLIASVMIISIIINKSPVGLIAGIGAFSAVLLLVFQDTILGFVSSIQLSYNDLVRNGDWITMNKFAVDGVVEEINIVSVKVRNFDNTVSTIPVRQIVADSFQNWRGMQEKGMRRVNRTFNIDITTIKPCSSEMIAKYKEVTILKEYVEKMELEIATYNAERNYKDGLVPEGRHQTNVGVLRAYIIEYLKHHPEVNANATMMVRQLPPNEYGLPLNLYFFVNTTDWIEYERIQADIFDYIYSVLDFFEIRAYQREVAKKSEI